MAKHNWKEYGFDFSSNVIVNGKMITTCTHILKCIACDLVIGNSDLPKERIACNDWKEDMNDCTQKRAEKVKEVEKPKEPWKAPMKDRKVVSDSDIKSKDYPAKRTGQEAKRRK